MKGACARARRAWLLAQDGRAGIWGRLAMKRHFRVCADCRDFIADAEAIFARAPRPEFAPPSDRVAGALHIEAAAALYAAREAERLEIARSRSRQSLVGSLAGACAALALLLALPGPGLPPAPPGTTSGPAVLDDNIESLEDRMNCLRNLVDDFNWNSLEGESPCIDT